MKKTFLILLVIFPLLLILTSACATKSVETKLGPDSEEFYSKVRYIITKEESKIFLELPPSDRSEFIEYFWKRRDPTPESETNENKEKYFIRIEEANHLFRGGGRPGWLQDRGRIYILFGPPDERQTNPMGGYNVDPYADAKEMTSAKRVAAGQKPSEVWIYYNLLSSMQRPHTVRLVFVDSHGTGDYRLISNLDELLPGTMGIESHFSPDLIYTHELSKEEANRADLTLDKQLFDFSWEFVKRENPNIGSNLLIHIALPYKKIIFTQAADKLQANLEVEIRITDKNKKVLWQLQEMYKLHIKEDVLIQNEAGAWEAEIPVTQWLKKGNYSVHLAVKNHSGSQEIRKLLPLKI